jgi:acyl carrier protein
MNKSEQLLQIFKEVLETNTIDDTVSQTNCDAWDSIHHLNLILAIESGFNISLEPEEMEQMQDFATALKIVEVKSA